MVPGASEGDGGAHHRGDPALMDDDVLVELLQKVSDIKHVSRIRIGTRLPVVLPMRFTDRLVTTIGRSTARLVRTYAWSHTSSTLTR